jgi:cytochrome c
MRRMLCTIAVLGLAACGAPQDQTADPAGPTTQSTATVAANDAAPESFVQCKTCHSTQAGTHGVGPSLAGVAGSKAGAQAGFAYSPAMQSAGHTWDDANLDKFIAAPMKHVPGTRMTYAGQPDPAKRAEIIAYLKTLK